MKCPKCKCTFRDKSNEYAPDICSDCADSEFPSEGVTSSPAPRPPTIKIESDKPWRPYP